MTKNIFLILSFFCSTFIIATPLSVVTVTQEQAALVQRLGGDRSKNRLFNPI